VRALLLGIPLGIPSVASLDPNALLGSECAQMLLQVASLASANLLALRLGLRDRELARSYLSNCIRLYDELVGHGLKRNDPLSYLHQQGWGASSFDDRLVLPAGLKDDSGTRIDELLILAMVTKVLSPNRVFEIGTYNGRTTSIFALNTPQGDDRGADGAGLRWNFWVQRLCC